MAVSKASNPGPTPERIQVVDASGRVLGEVPLERYRGECDVEPDAWKNGLQGRALVLAADRGGPSPERAHVVVRDQRLAVVPADNLTTIEAEQLAAIDLAERWSQLSLEEQRTAARELVMRHQQLIEADKRAEAKRRDRERTRRRRGQPLEDLLEVEIAPDRTIQVPRVDCVLDPASDDSRRLALLLAEMLLAGADEAANELARAFIQPRRKGPGYAEPLHLRPGAGSNRKSADRVVARALSLVGWRPAEIAELLGNDDGTIAGWLAEI